MAKTKKPAAPYQKKRGNSPARYYFSYQGQTIALGSDRDEAFKKYHEILAGGAVSGLSVAELVKQFLDYHRHVKGSKPGTVRFYDDALQRYSDKLGRRPAASIGVADLDSIFVGWTIGPTTRSNVVRSLRAVHKFGMERHGLTSNPAQALPKGKTKARNIEYTDEFWASVMAALDNPKGRPCADLLTLLWRTGARPKELREARPDQYNKAKRWIEIEAPEAKGGEEARVIRLDDECVAILDRYLAEYKGTPGPILRNNKGKAWTRSALGSWAHRLKQKGIGLTVYGVRHTWATRAIRRGVNLIYIAQMMGHKDLKQLQATYSAVSRKDDVLADALKQING